MSGIKPSPQAAEILTRLARVLGTDPSARGAEMEKLAAWVSAASYRTLTLTAIAVIVAEHSTITPAVMRSWAETMRTRTLREYR